MNHIFSIAFVILFSFTHAQFESGFVKILEDQRYQDGASFGNFRNQEDGIKYKEETNPQGIRTGFWEYPDETGQIKRVEFEAGSGIGFRITNSNIADKTPIHKSSSSSQLAQPNPKPRTQTQIQPQQHQPILQHQSQPQLHHQPQPQLHHQPQQIHVPLTKQSIVATQKPIQPEPVHIFDYPADLQFFRDNAGHRFKFSAV